MSVDVVERLRLNEDDWLFDQTARDARREITTLREQVEKLTKERDAYCALNGDNNKGRDQQAIFAEGVRYGKALVGQEPKEKGQLGPMDILRQQLAALAEQNEKMQKLFRQFRDEVLFRIGCNSIYRKDVVAPYYERVKEALSLPDLASPVLNKYRAEGMREGAIVCDEAVAKWEGPWKNAANTLGGAIRARAAELENEDAN